MLLPYLLSKNALSCFFILGVFLAFQLINVAANDDGVVFTDLQHTKTKYIRDSKPNAEQKHKKSDQISQQPFYIRFFNFCKRFLLPGTATKAEDIEKLSGSISENHLHKKSTSTVSEFPNNEMENKVGNSILTFFLNFAKKRRPEKPKPRARKQIDTFSGAATNTLRIWVVTLLMSLVIF